MAMQLHVAVAESETKVTVSVDAGATGNVLKAKLQYSTQISPEDQLLYLECPDGTGKTLLDDERPLSEQGVSDGLEILLRKKVLNWQFQDGMGTKEHIQRHGRLSYYHTDRVDRSDISDEYRVVSGGEPVKLEEKPPEKVVRITNYTWANDKGILKVFIDAENEPRAVEAAGDGKDGKVSVQFTETSFAMKIKGEGLIFEFDVPITHMEIVPAKSKFRVSQGKRITISLQKVEDKHDWFVLTGK